MHIEVLYFKGCPNYLTAIDNLNAALQSLSMHQHVTVEPKLVTTQAEADELHFVGSPTFKIADRDLFGEPAGADFGLRCRIYRFGERMVGNPAVQDFAEVLRKLSSRPRPQSQPPHPR